MADRPDFHPAQDALRDLSGRVPGESRYGGPGQPPLSLSGMQRGGGPDFRDSPLLHSGSGSQAAQSHRKEATSPPSVHETLSTVGVRIHGTLIVVEHIWSQLDEWEGVQPAPTPANAPASPDSQLASLDARPPGIQEVAGGLLGLSETLHFRVMSLEKRLGHLMALIGGL
jgi:hypothetical protein